MKRRKFITNVGAVGFYSTVAGCSVRTNSSTSTNTLTPTKTPTDPETPITSPTQSPEMEELIAEARTELNTAFNVIHSMEFHRGDKVFADPEKFKQYNHKKALSHVENARRPLASIKQLADGKRQTTRYGILAGLALIAEEGAKLYDKLRKTFREGWQYEYAYKKAAYEEAVEQAGEARMFLADIPAHRKEVADGIESVARLQLDPHVDSFDLQRWADIDATIKAQTPALSAMFSGFEDYTEAVVYDNRGKNAMNNENPEVAYKSFQKAIDKVNGSKGSLKSAKEGGATFFDERLDGYYCRAPGMEEAYSIHLQAANALADGKKQTASDLLEKGTDRIVEAINGCQKD